MYKFPIGENEVIVSSKVQYGLPFAFFQLPVSQFLCLLGDAAGMFETLNPPVHSEEIDKMHA